MTKSIQRKPNTRQTTIDKYVTYLKSALIKVDKDPTLSSVEFCRKNHLPAGWFRAAIDLKFIAQSYKGRFTSYSAILPPGVINEGHARQMAEKLMEYNYNHTNNPPIYKQNEKIKEEVQEKGLEKMIEDKVCGCGKSSVAEKRRFHSEVEGFTDEALIQELRRRGYTGKLVQTNTVEL